MTIGGWRKKIDEIDMILLQLLNLRAEFAVEVARLKEEEGLALCAPERELKVLERMQNSNAGPLDREAVGRIYRLIMDETRRLEAVHVSEEPKRSEGRRRRTVRR